MTPLCTSVQITKPAVKKPLDGISATRWRAIPMPRKKLSRNAPCPCGSGKKNKKCCWGKGFDWEEDEEGTLYKSTPLSPEMKEVLEQQRQKFIDKYGREPGPSDPVFFDMPPLEHIEHQTVEAMKKAGIDPPITYPYGKTGRPLTDPT